MIKIDKFEKYIIKELAMWLGKMERDQSENDLTSWMELNVYEELLDVLVKYRKHKTL